MKRSMKILKNCCPVLYPQFQTRMTTKDDELVLLKVHDEREDDRVLNEKKINCSAKHDSAYGFYSKTECESLENHIHLFDDIKKKDKEAARRFSMAIAQNLKRALLAEFPNKRFIIYLDFDYKDSVIIRFHQQWPDEPLFYPLDKYEHQYKTGKFIILQ